MSCSTAACSTSRRAAAIEPEHATDAAREVGDRERVARRVHVLRLERAHERVDRGQEARLELAGDALAVERERGLQRHALEQRELGRAERPARQPQQAERADQRAVQLHRHLGRSAAGGIAAIPVGSSRSLARRHDRLAAASRSSDVERAIALVALDARLVRGRARARRSARCRRSRRATASSGRRARDRATARVSASPIVSGVALWASSRARSSSTCVRARSSAACSCRTAFWNARPATCAMTSSRRTSSRSKRPSPSPASTTRARRSRARPRAARPAASRRSASSEQRLAAAASTSSACGRSSPSDAPLARARGGDRRLPHLVADARPDRGAVVRQRLAQDAQQRARDVGRALGGRERARERLQVPHLLERAPRAGDHRRRAARDQALVGERDAVLAEALGLVERRVGGLQQVAQVGCRRRASSRRRTTASAASRPGRCRRGSAAGAGRRCAHWPSSSPAAAARTPRRRCGRRCRPGACRGAAARRPRAARRRPATCPRVSLSSLKSSMSASTSAKPAGRAATSPRIVSWKLRWLARPVRASVAASASLRSNARRLSSATAACATSSAESSTTSAGSGARPP